MKAVTAKTKTIAQSGISTRSLPQAQSGLATRRLRPAEEFGHPIVGLEVWPASRPASSSRNSLGLTPRCHAGLADRRAASDHARVAEVSPPQACGAAPTSEPPLPVDGVALVAWALCTGGGSSSSREMREVRALSADRLGPPSARMQGEDMPSNEGDSAV